MRRIYLLPSLIVVAALALMLPGVVLAHGEPVIAVNPAVVAAGGAITITGTEMEPGEVFVLTLEGPAGSVPLGEATVTGEGEEGGFTVSLTIPAETAPGSYLVQAATEEGETATADLTVTAPTTEASAGPATVQEPSGEPHLIGRTKPSGQIVVVGILIALSVAAGFALLRSRG
ncbi:MAG: hypothetical protein KJ077_01990 [Anaerolineae bacterium]|nr:hypothetical protein [Anaerolineae bacterium]GIK37085.1 MAG: hypothetical protein BroJett011_09180 [Chloroflexota bacterium]